AVGCFFDCDFTSTAIATTTASNTQTGDNSARARQAAGASSGDGVAGQVIGAVTSGGPSQIGASNTSGRVDVVPGDADASNSANTFAGLNIGPLTSTATGSLCLGSCVPLPGFATTSSSNSQVGDNHRSAGQAAHASSGDAVGGQVIAATSVGGPT